MPPSNKTAEAITLLAEAIKGLEQKIDEHFAPKKVEKVEVKSEDVVAPGQDSMPQEYRQIINERLSEKFKAEIKYRSDANFELSIWVPREYSNAPKGHWDLNHEDKRFLVIQNAMGAIGVREWVDKIAENLGPDIRMRIENDRYTAV